MHKQDQSRNAIQDAIEGAIREILHEFDLDSVDLLKMGVPREMLLNKLKLSDFREIEMYFGRMTFVRTENYDEIFEEVKQIQKQFKLL